MSVVGLIRPLNKKNSFSSKAPIHHHNNPLFNSHPQERSSPIKRQMQFPKPSSPINKKSFLPPGSPIPRSPRVCAGSPMREPRSPLSPKDLNKMTSTPMMKSSPKSSLSDTPRPVATHFHQNLNETLRQGPRKSRPNSINAGKLSPLVGRKRPSSMYSPKTEERIAKSILEGDIKIPPYLPPPPKAPNSKIQFSPLPNELPRLEPKKKKLNKSKLSKTQPITSSENNLIADSISSGSIEETIEKLKRKSTRQMDLAVYQAIQLFCCSPIHHRSIKILKCLLQFNTKQLVQYIFANLNSSHGVTRRNAADILSSLVLYNVNNDVSIQKDLQNLLETLAMPENLSILLNFIKDDDFIIRSYITGILATLHVEPSLYLCNQNSSSKFSSKSNYYSFDGVSKIIHLLSDKNIDIKESALTAIMCLGPVAATAVDDLDEFLLKEKSSNLRILACRALNEIGSPYAIQALGTIQEIIRKDKDESVKIVAQEVLDHLRKSSTADGSYVKSYQNESKCNVNESSVKKAIYEIQSVQKAPVNFGDLKQYFLHTFPTISKDNPNWKKQLKETLKDMVYKGNVSKTPATFSLC